MKRLLLFLLLFAAGLGVLLVVQKAQQDKRQSTTPVAAPSAPEPQRSAASEAPLPAPEAEPEPATAPAPAEAFTESAEIELGPETPTLATPLPQGDGQVQPTGKISVTKYNGAGGPTLYRIAAEDVRSVSAESYELVDVTLDIHDSESGELRTTVEAASARVRAQFTESGFEFDESHPNLLTDVELLIHSGSPLAPLRAHVPEMTLRLDEQRLVSDDPVLVEGRGLQITGEGLAVDRNVETLQIDRDPTVRMRFEDGTRAELAARGNLLVSSSGPQGRQEIELIAADAARLDFTTETQARLAAGSIRLIGQVKPVTEGEDARFAPTAVEALQGAVFTTPDGIFEGDRGRLVFDEEGSAKRAILAGKPRLTFDLSDMELGDLAELGGELDEPDGELPLEVSGAGPIEIGLGATSEVRFGGPVELRMPSVDITVNAETGIGGSRNAALDRISLAIRGAVVVQHGDATLQAPELVIDSVAGATEDADRSGRLTSTGPTQTTGKLADGSPFTLSTVGKLILERNAEGFSLPLAEGVDIDVRGESPFVARADTVRDFVEATVSFRADGNVRFASEAGEGSGEQLRVEGPDRAVIAGARGSDPSSERARFDFDGGWLEAAVVEIDGDVLDARDGVTLEMRAEDQTYRLSARWVQVDQTGEIEGDDRPGLVVLDALGEVVASVEHDEGWSSEIVSDTLRLKALSNAAPTEGDPTPEDAEAAVEARFSKLSGLDPQELVAEGNVNFGYSADYTMNGRGERLVLRADGTGELTPVGGDRIQLDGRMPSNDADFSMSSLDVEFSKNRLIADGSDLRLDGLSTGFQGKDDPGGRIRVVAGRMASDEASILLTEGAHISQEGTEEEAGWFLYSDKVLLTGVPEEGRAMTGGAVRDMLAWGGFVASFGEGREKIQTSGDSLQVIRESEVLKLAGEPAVVELDSFQWAAEWFELDLQTSVIRAGPGEVRGSQATQDSWRMTYNSIEPVENPSETIQVIREPVILTRNEEVRAAWAMFWVDNSEWSAMSHAAVGHDSGPGVPLPETRPRKAVHPESLFGRLQSTDGAEWLREIYLEGNVTYTKRGQRIARADSIYLDLIDGHGWIRRVDFSVDLPFMDDGQLKLRARWMRHSADGSFFASSAVATTCGHEEPHYVIRIGDLEIDPRTKKRDLQPGENPRRAKLDEPDGWDITTRDTSLRLYDQLEVPLPRIGVPVTPDMKVDTERLSLGGLHPVHFGNDSKLGTFIGTTVTRDLGWLAKSVHRLLTGAEAPSLDLEGKTDYRASWNNDRGVLLGLSSEFSVEDRYFFTAAIDGLFDRGDDEGLIRVPEDDREEWRAWYRTRGRYDIDPEEWVDVVVSVQEDAAVQSEFFENDFLDFEERESYVHWRKADEADYVAGTVEAALNSFQSEIVTQELRHARARTAVAGLTKDIPVLYSSATSLAYLDREQGDPRFPSPFDPRFIGTDGWGEEAALRVDSRHRIETPFSLGFAGIRATPFLEARGTAWDIGEVDNSAFAGVTSADNPTRVGLLGGIELGTTTWRVFQNGVRHVLSPFIGYRQDLASEEDDEPLVLYDRVENPIDGRFFDLGLRTRVDSELNRNFIDLEVVQSYADAFPDKLGGSDVSGWLPMQVNGSMLGEAWGIGFGLKHDARYDIENDLTPYSRTIVGFDPVPALGLELGYHNARDLSGQRLYNAFSTGARYAFSPKWELDGRYVFSTQGNGRLSSEFGVRRFGHDFVFEVSTRFRQGEGGGTSFQFDVIPLLAYDEPGESLVERWRSRRY